MFWNFVFSINLLLFSCSCLIYSLEFISLESIVHIFFAPCLIWRCELSCSEFKLNIHIQIVEKLTIPNDGIVIEDKRINN